MTVVEIVYVDPPKDWTHHQMLLNNPVSLTDFPQKLLVVCLQGKQFICLLNPYWTASQLKKIFFKIITITKILIVAFYKYDVN